MLADWPECFPLVLEALQVRLEIMAPVLWIAERGPFEVHHNHLGWSRILATMAHSSDILGLHHQSLVASIVSCWMGQGVRTGERLEMVAAKTGNCTPVVDETDLGVVQIECLCSVYFQHYYLMLPHFNMGVIMNQTARPLEQYWLSLVKICSWTSYVNKW